MDEPKKDEVVKTTHSTSKGGWSNIEIDGRDSSKDKKGINGNGWKRTTEETTNNTGWRATNNTGWINPPLTSYQVEQKKLKEEFENKTHAKCKKIFEKDFTPGWGSGLCIGWECYCHSEHVFQYTHFNQIRYVKQ